MTAAAPTVRFGRSNVLTALAIACAGAAAFVAAAYAMRSGDDPTRYGVPVERWPQTLRHLAKTEDEAGFAPRYAHDLPNGWRLVEIATRRDGSGMALTEVVYGNDDGALLAVRQQAGAPPSLGEGYAIVQRKDGWAALRMLANGALLVSWPDGPVWVEVESRLTERWDLPQLLRTLESVY